MLAAAFVLVAAVGYYSGRLTDARNPFEDPEASVAEHKIQRLCQNNSRRQLIAHELIAGGLTLQDAIDQFRIVSKNDPDYSWQLFRAAHPGATDDERLGHQVIAYVTTATLRQFLLPSLGLFLRYKLPIFVSVCRLKKTDPATYPQAIDVHLGWHGKESVGFSSDASITAFAILAETMPDSQKF
jgi:hypothetical protein